MQIHWHEGLFLQPHHFQRMQRGFLEQLHGQQQLIAPYPFGVIEARVAMDALADFRLHFDLLRVLMPNGQEVHFPDNADLPDVRLKPLLDGSPGGVIILLGLPKWSGHQPNTLDTGPHADTRARLLYRVVSEKVPDENTGGNKQDMLIRRLNAQLIAEQEDATNLETVPVLRVRRGVGENVDQAVVDPDYIPPSLYLGRVPQLNEMVRDLVDKVRASHAELISQMNRQSFNMATLHGQQFEQVLRLRTLSRFAVRLPALLRASRNVTPFQWYLELRELLGELQALKLGSESFEVPDYDHENLWFSFNQLSTKVRDILRSTVESAYQKVLFRKEATCCVAKLTEEQVTRPTEYLLAVETSQDPMVIRQLIKSRLFKFQSWPTKPGVQVFGVPMEEAFAPHFLPNHPGLLYFRLLREGSAIWEQIKNSKEKDIGVYWPDFAKNDFRLTLYLILPSS